MKTSASIITLLFFTNHSVHGDNVKLNSSVSIFRKSGLRGGRNKLCDTDVKECNDSSFVSRNPKNNCKFEECHSNKRTLVGDSPSPVPINPPIPSTGWRIWTTAASISDSDFAWDVSEIEFYGNIDCTGDKIPNNGTPIDSGNSGSGWGPENAFGGTGSWIWGGRYQDVDGPFWIGMEYQNPVSVKCVRVQNYKANAAEELQIQTIDPKTDEWKTVWIATGLDVSGFALNTIPIQNTVVVDCTEDVKKCDDGSVVSRDPSNMCQFEACPSNNIVFEKSNSPSPVPIKPSISSTGWRIWTTAASIPDSDFSWDVSEIEFYGNIDCTGDKIPNNGTPIDSGNSGSGWGPENAFGGTGSWIWGGRYQDVDGPFWIGMNYQNPVSVKCVRVQNYKANAAEELQIQT
jgi:hypothetical protein